MKPKVIVGIMAILWLIILILLIVWIYKVPKEETLAEKAERERKEKAAADEAERVRKEREASGSMSSTAIGASVACVLALFGIIGLTYFLYTNSKVKEQVCSKRYSYRSED